MFPGRFPRTFLTLLSATLAAVAGAQTQVQPQAPEPPPTHPANATVLHAGTQLVIVDVVVQDKDGHPIHGLKKEDFSLLEDKKPQEVTTFEEHALGSPAKPGPAMPNMPPGTFTNYTPAPPSGALNILLLDALNTPMKDQSYVRYQLQQYVNKADPGTRIAIFGLNNRLTILQGFTSDPQVLKNAVDHKLLPRASNLLDDPVGTDSDSDLLSSGLGSSQASANVAQFEAMTASFQMQLRMQYTLDAFNVLARYLSGFPGRKNLIWFSGSFPLDILPDASLADPFSVVASSEDEFRETTSLLTRAEVAIYPIDARGLMVNPVFSAARSGRGMTTGPAFANAIASFGQSQALEHITMEAMANDTGGHAFYNTNGLADAVAKAIETGSNYYTIAYTPTNRKWDGNYRNIAVKLSGAYNGYKLAYRQGYFADDPDHPHNKEEAVSMTEAAAVQSHSAVAYADAAMARGAPTPQDILFKVRVLPASTTTEDTLAAGNVPDPDPKSKLKGPYRRFDIDYAALAAAVTLKAQPDGSHTGAVEFTVLLYDPDGKLLNAAGKSVNINLTPENYKQYLEAAKAGTGIGAHLEISAPVKQETYLRIAIHDIPSNHFGVVEVPVSSVIHLPPAPPTPITATPPNTNPTPPTPQ